MHRERSEGLARLILFLFVLVLCITSVPHTSLADTLSNSNEPSKGAIENAVAWAKAMLSVDPPKYQGYCAAFVAKTYNSPTADAPSAIALWNKLAVKHKRDYNAPKGSLVFFGANKDYQYGHVVLCIGDGNVIQSVQRTDSIKQTTIMKIEDAHIYNGYLGWAWPPSKWPGISKIKTVGSFVVSDYKAPTLLALGKSYTLKGLVAFKEDLEYFKAQIINSKNKIAAVKTVIMSSTANKERLFDIYKSIDKYIKFEALPEDNYQYVVTAKTKKGKTIELLNESFSMKKDTLSIKMPSIFDISKFASATATLTSAVSKISKFEIGVYNSKGARVTGGSFNPNARTVDIVQAFKKYINVMKIGRGKFTLKIAASNAAGKKTLFNQNFQIP